MEKAIELFVWLTEREFAGKSFNGPSLMKTLGQLSPDQAITRDTYEGYSVWGIVLHLMYWKHHLTGKLDQHVRLAAFPYEEKDWPALPDDPGKAAWQKTLGELEAMHRDYIQALKAFSPSRLDEEFKAWHCSYGQAMAWMATHDTYHVAQIRNMGLKDLKIE